MKASELKTLLDQVTTDRDPDVVTGETWLPERLVNAELEDGLLFLAFDNAPDDAQSEEARGFVEHEIELIGQRFKEILTSNDTDETKADALLALFLLGHERSSTEVIELLETIEGIEPQHTPPAPTLE